MPKKYQTKSELCSLWLNDLFKKYKKSKNTSTIKISWLGEESLALGFSLNLLKTILKLKEKNRKILIDEDNNKITVIK